MHVPTGEYLVRFYTRYGEHIRDMDTLAPTLYGALEQRGAVAVGRAMVGLNGVASFTVDRRVFNSLDGL
jgi:hypothetical protein